MGAEEVRSRAVRGSAVVAMRGLAIRTFGFATTVVVAHLLLPSELGVIAFGATLVAAGTFFADGGLAAALIRRPAAPSPEELGGVLSLQLIVTTALACATATCALPFGQVGRVTAIMVVALPLTSFKTPAMVLLERQLNYGPIAVAEVAEAAGYALWAIGALSLGFGVYGLGSALLIRPLIGTMVLLVRVPQGRVTPRWRWALVRPLLGFGLSFQAINIVNLVRDEGLNVAIASIAGVQVLGLWSLAYSIMQGPFLLFEALWRVSYPTLARLLELGEEPAAVLSRGLAVGAAATSLLLVPLAASAPLLIPAIFGKVWQPVAAPVIFACVGLAIGGPISVATAGYLYAVGDSGRVLVSAIIHTVVWFAVALPLLARMGVDAVGVGWAISAGIEGVILAAAVRRRIRFRVLAVCWRPWLLSPLIVVSVQASPLRLQHGLLGATCSAAIAELAIAAVLVISREPAIRDLRSLVRRLRRPLAPA